ncbi:type II 3-dehydroquinate dehydratase [Bartonella tamiae]|uniref:3-dehydroquinate dehydratase n=1 Tax=Bartonella tamiae Th239 TaxID=1094558 RepID=J1K2A5_9HYPH|nr:type II 3-dehydroquinate dehydratase [Bartonella tamiae]EJF91240.1 3-dehydroquinate dehydratase, type II [Bartonella tamiae Th239]EJF93095.1 3-dehydroquinate dehydratase, type II [Bartonella tamiae Th307]
MTQKIMIVNGPNLNLLGTREPDIYGSESLKDIEKKCFSCLKTYDVRGIFHQSNHEGELVEYIHEAIKTAHGIIINPAAYSHTSIALLDALKMFQGPVVEVHLSNIHKREPFRHHSFISSRADAVIAGCGSKGYEFAIHFIMNSLNE